MMIHNWAKNKCRRVCTSAYICHPDFSPLSLRLFVDIKKVGHYGLLNLFEKAWSGVWIETSKTITLLAFPDSLMVMVKLKFDCLHMKVPVKILYRISFINKLQP